MRTSSSWLVTRPLPMSRIGWRYEEEAVGLERDADALDPRDALLDLQAVLGRGGGDAVAARLLGVGHGEIGVGQDDGGGR